MRFALILLTACLATAGCSSPEEPATIPDPEPEAPVQDVQLQEADFGSVEATVTSGQPATGSVSLPNGTQNLTVQPRFMTANMVSFTVVVDGCDPVHWTGVVAGTVMSTLERKLACASAPSGDVGLTISVDGMYVGEVALAGLVPLAAQPGSGESR